MHSCDWALVCPQLGFNPERKIVQPSYFHPQNVENDLIDIDIASDIFKNALVDIDIDIFNKC